MNQSIFLERLFEFTTLFNGLWSHRIDYEEDRGTVKSYKLVFLDENLSNVLFKII